MIESQDRLFLQAVTHSLEPGGCSDWRFIDWDARRWLLFEAPTALFGDSDMGEVDAVKALMPILDHLSPGVTKVTFATDGARWKSSKDSADDITPRVPYPQFTKDIVGHLFDEALQKDHWTEVDRLAPGVDLIQVSFGRSTALNDGLEVFKYTLLSNEKPMRLSWRSAFIHRGVSGHANVVPFRHFVVDDTVRSHRRFVGYTTKYIPGGSLDIRRPGMVFKTEWLSHLTTLVDDLNLRYGVVHQDIAPRNLLLDPNDARGQLLLFDFGWAEYVGGQDIQSSTNDIAGLAFTIYELLTNDRQFSTITARGPQQLSSIMDAHRTWALARDVVLEPGVTTKDIQKVLRDWAQKRSQMSTGMTQKFDLRSQVIVPPMRQDPIIPGVNATNVVRWERPPAVRRKARH